MVQMVISTYIVEMQVHLQLHSKWSIIFFVSQISLDSFVLFLIKVEGRPSEGHKERPQKGKHRGHLNFPRKTILQIMRLDNV